MPSNYLILCCPLLLLPSILLSIRVFSSESFLRIRWPKCWSFSFSISPSSEHSELISFGIDWFHLLAVQFSSVTQSCPTLCNPVNRSTPGLHVHHQPPESTQTHVHWVSDAIQPSHPLLSPSPPALNVSQHQGLFRWVLGTLKSLLQHHSSKTSILHTQLSLQSNSCIHTWLLEKP